jgi:predicted CxxxxCH...CXXCH cytochrome family protein
MRRVAWVGAAAAAAALGLVGCGESRPSAAPIAGETSCGSCHTTPGQPLPFRDLSGSSDTTRLSVGAHDRHLDPVLTEQPLSCNECHTLPLTVNDPGHLEDAPTDMRFGPLATTGGAAPVYTAPSCAATYCHGNFPGGNAGNTPNWVAARADACGTCHELPPPTGRHQIHVDAAVDCTECHGNVETDTHIDGIKTIVLPIWDPGARGCAASACHGAQVWGPL